MRLRTVHFVLRFLAAFAVLIPLGAYSNAATHYAGAVEASARALSPLVTGWTFETPRDDGDRRPHFRREREELDFLLDPEALALGLIPLLSLIAATCMPWRRTARAALLGCLALLALDVSIVVIYPTLVHEPNAVKDIAGTLLGMLIFVGAPAILWFALTYDHLRATWRLE